MKYNEIPRKEALRLHSRWAQGESITDIARTRGVTNVAIQLLFKRHKLSVVVTKKCALTECDNVISTHLAHKIGCCRAHMRKAQSRVTAGIVVTKMPCALPECDVLVWVLHKKGAKPTVGGTKTFCSRNHAATHVRRQKSGIYARLVSRSPCCEVCGEWRIIDVHHEEFHRQHGSVLHSPIHHLCPTHHYMIHRGLATFHNGKYTILAESIAGAFLRKRGNYSDYTPFSKSWLEAKG